METRTYNSGMWIYMLLLMLLAGTSCSGNRKGLGGSCVKDSQCDSRLCVASQCVDPWGDFDGDGLSNQEERMLHTNPASPDTDGDGIPDGQELGDSDHDGIIDALESAVNDQDEDCLPDQFDPHNTKPDATSAQLARWMCNHKGVCGMGAGYIRAYCKDKGTKQAHVVCDFSKVPNFEETEHSCDGLDNDCNGKTDEGFSLDGVPVGGLCQAPGVCGQGVVECNDTGDGVRCSSGPKGSQYKGGKEKCNGLDDNCNGKTDEGLTYNGLELGQPCAGVGECGVGVVECGADGKVTCSTNPNGSDYQGKPEECDGLDDDCNGITDDVTDTKSLAAQCPIMGVCAEYPDRVTATCKDGHVECDYSGVPGYAGTTEKACDGLDDDCDGRTDEDFVYVEAGRRLHVGDQCGLGVCKGGVVQCGEDGLSTRCSSMHKAGKELCNNIDDNCNGRVDDGISKAIGNKVTVAWWGMPAPRLDAAAATMQDRIVIYGGTSIQDNGEPLFDLYVIDPKDKSSHVVDTQALPHLTMPSAVTVGSDLLIFGNSKDGPPSVFMLDKGLDKVTGHIQVDAEAVCADVMAGKGPGDTALMYCADTVTKKGRIFIIQPHPLSVTGRLATTYITGGCMGFDRLSGTVMIAGGRNRQGNIASQLIKVDEKSGDTSVTDLSTLMPPVADAACADLGNGRILIQGGITPQGPSNDTYIVSPDSDTSLLATLGGPPANARPFAAVWDNKVVVFDGASAPARVIRAWLLDPDTATWSDLSVQPDLPGGTDIVNAVDQDTGALYVFVPAGKKLAATAWITSLIQNDVLRFQKHAFSGDLPSRGARAACNSKGHVIWFFGGSDTNVYKLDLTGWECNALAVQGEQPPPRDNPLVVFSPSMNGLIVFGGTSAGRYLTDCWLFRDNKWLRLDHQKRNLYGMHHAVWDEARDHIIVFTEQGSVLLFDAVNGSWQDTGYSLSQTKLTDAVWDPYSRIAILLQDGMQRAVSVYVSPEGQINTNNTQLTGRFPILSGASVFFDPFMRRIVIAGGVDSKGLPSAAVLMLNEVCQD